MKPSLFTAVFVGMLLFMFLLSAEPFQPKPPLSSASGESLSVAHLGPTERIVIITRAVDCFSVRERLYQVEGGQFAASPLDLCGYARQPENPLPLIGRLQTREIVGLDAYLRYVRGVPTVRNSTGRDYVVIGYYRDGRKIGEEHYADRTGYLSFMSEEDGDIVPPVAIERRLAASEAASH